MEKIPAGTGWAWIVEGFALFRKQPVELSMLFLLYLLLTFGLARIPVLGPISLFVLAPVFSMTFMQACADIEQGKRVLPNLILFGFRSPAMRPLLIFGFLSLAATIGAILSSTLIDGGMFVKMISGKIKPDEKMIQESNMSLAMLFAVAVYIPAAMALWYAAPLAAWQNMKVGKALFYSFFAVRKAAKAFIVYFLCWGLIGLALFIGTASGLGILFGPLGVIVILIKYCSFYPSYTRLFGSTPAQESQEGMGGIDGNENTESNKGNKDNKDNESE